ncbi:MAG: YegP family protein [Xanthobacteraceae bacterium]
MRSAAYRFEIYKDKAGEYRVRFKAPNGETLLSSEGYKNLSSAQNCIASVKRNVNDADTDDNS